MSKKLPSVLETRDTRKYGKGVFAVKDIPKGTVLYQLSGKRITLGELVNRVLEGNESIDDPFQVGRRTYIDLDEISRTFNHSCEPTGGIRKRSELFALRDIKKGDEVTYDYSMTIAPTDWSMKCGCGSKLCRKVIHDVRSVPVNRRSFYKEHGAIQQYMKPLLKEIDSGTYTIPRYEELALERLGDKNSL